MFSVGRKVDGHICRQISWFKLERDDSGGIGFKIITQYIEARFRIDSKEDNQVSFQWREAIWKGIFRFHDEPSVRTSIGRFVSEENIMVKERLIRKISELNFYGMLKLIDKSYILLWFSIMCRQLTSEGVINWNLLSSGSFSSTFSRELSSSAAGKSGFSFGLEVSGMMLKRSNLEFFFDSPIKTSETSRRTKLVQVS